MTKRLIQHGNSDALVIEKAKESESDLLASLARVNRHHGKTLEKLAH